MRDDQPELFGLMDIGLTFQQINRILEKKYGLSIVQWYFLRNLAEMPTITPNALAKTLKVSPGTLSETLVRLKKRDYIFVKEDPNDARKKIIVITRLGKSVLDSISLNYKVVFGDIKEIESELKAVRNFLSQTRHRLGTDQPNPN